MSADERYNGWANRETWAVALHIENDEGWWNSVQETLSALVGDDPDPENREDLAYAAGQAVKDNVTDTIDMLHEAGAIDTLHDLLDDLGSLWRVDWTEIGAAFLDAVAETGGE